MSSDFIALRLAASRAIGQVFSERRPLDDALPERHAQRDWLLETTAGTLRYWGRIDWILRSVCEKKPPTGALKRTLATGIYQLLAQTRTNPVSVVHETVEAIKRKEGAPPAKFANAILRRLTDRLDAWRDVAYPRGGDLAARAGWASLPEWLFERLVASHGESWVERFARAGLERPAIWVRSRSALALPAGPVEGSFRFERGDVGLAAFLEQNAAFVQDISSQYLVEEFSRRVRTHFGDRSPGAIHVLDPCAAPGGKSVGLAWNGFDVTASDRDETRLRLLSDNLKRLAPLGTRIVSWEAEPAEHYDWVWLDAPCSSLGLIRRHPEVRWIKQASDVAALVEQQAQLLNGVWKKLKSGGILTYSVCSVLAEECEAHRCAMIERGVSAEALSVSPFDAGEGDGFQAFMAVKP